MVTGRSDSQNGDKIPSNNKISDNTSLVTHQTGDANHTLYLESMSLKVVSDSSCSQRARTASQELQTTRGAALWAAACLPNHHPRAEPTRKEAGTAVATLHIGFGLIFLSSGKPRAEPPSVPVQRTRAPMFKMLRRCFVSNSVLHRRRS